MVFDISIWKVVLAAVVYFVIGAVWYSPVLFSKPWMAALGKKEGEVSMARSAMVTTALAILVLTVVEAYFVHVTGAKGLWRGLYLGLKLWLGFVATTALVNSVFQSRNRQLYVIDQGYHLVGIALAGAILAW